MNKLKLKAVAVLLSGGMVSFAMADMHNNQNNNANLQNGQPAAAQTAPNDAALTNDIKAAMSDYADKVNVSVRQGVVYLAGELPSDTDYEKVIIMAESVKGVRDVNVDALTVKESQAPLYDTYITAKVKGLLIQKDIMGTDIPSWTLSVETKNGIVYLSGTVANQDEKQKVLDLAKSVQGVTSVEDKMQIATASPASGTNTNGTMMQQNQPQDNQSTPANGNDNTQNMSY
ncbi:BON domain-containing protein [Legionella londiniensis]|uniref:Osmotically inducible protein Y n=1 Tax=Legionella londiniensis TaxID=45068 RepID=A0A0W0VIH6_9GAMM|nr:BON domain-containing protein [Legionella londiniensis]KTD19928.1 osmotically inducible protein Y [Legionella londiniensis]STX94199.1 osmotically inducible protein Y [Legionella londiniensis]